ncbi:hypothetical protein HY212_07880 [Candidatus Pacearchaeota archaeon]|nr:hypothetical protein [Candidatus Pacearchaeota archaeon]
MYIDGTQESTLKARLYTEFREIELERLRRDEPSRYYKIINNAQEFEHERWAYIDNKYSELRNDPNKKEEYLKKK